MTRAEIVAAVEAAYGVASASKVASDHGLTRNAVIGIWNRGRHAGRVGTMTRQDRVAQHDKGRARVAPRPMPPAAPRSLVFVGAVGAALAYVEADQGGPTCRWPIGDPRDADFRFCGEAVTTRTLPSADGRGRPNFYCEDCRTRSLGSRVEKFRPAVLGSASFAAPRKVKAGALRFGRASA